MRVTAMEQGNQSKETRRRAGGKRSRRKGERGEEMPRLDQRRKYDKVTKTQLICLLI